MEILSDLVVSVAQAEEALMDTITAQAAIIAEISTMNDLMYQRVLYASIFWLCVGAAVGWFITATYYSKKHSCLGMLCTKFNPFTGECAAARPNRYRMESEECFSPSGSGSRYDRHNITTTGDEG